MTDNSEFDALGELFHKKLVHHQAPVDPHGWSEIERRLTPPQRGKSVVWLWRGVSVAAAAAVVAWFFFPRTATNILPTPPTVTIVAQQTDTAMIEDTVTPANVLAAIQKPMEIRPSKTATPKTTEIHPSETETPKTPTELPIQVTPLEQEAPLVQERQEPTEKSENTGTQREEKEMPVATLWIENDLPIEKIGASKNKKWMLAAAFGAGSNRSLGVEKKGSANTRQDQFGSFKSGREVIGNNHYASYLSSSIQPFDKMTKSDYASIRHLPPLSFGVTASTVVGEMNLQFGLVYTYLASRFSWIDSGTNYDVRQSLHYIGIPVNFVGYLWNTQPNWKFYFSIGAMGEKGVRGIYRQELRSSSRTTFTTVKSTIDGFQWSLNGTLGISYRIKNRLNLYFEPRTGYHFNCKQPVSMRTEWPFYIGFGMGVNYELRVRN